MNLDSPNKLALVSLSLAVLIAILVALTVTLREGPEVAPEPTPSSDLAFIRSNEEWAWFLLHERAGRMPGPILGSDREENGRSDFRASWTESHLGVQTFVIDYEVDNYVYVAFRKENRVRQVLSLPVSSHRYLSFFVKGTPGTYLEISLRDDAGRQSLWPLVLPSTVGSTHWTNIKLDVDDLVPARNRDPVKDVETVAFAVVRRAEDGNRSIAGRLELAVISFTNDPAPRAGLPRISPADVERTKTFFNVDGPQHTTALPDAAAPPTTLERYQDEGSSSGIALYVLDTNSNWLGLAHGLKALGVPMRAVTRFSEAAKHPLVFMTPAVSSIRDDEWSAIIAYLNRGGSVFGIADRSLKDIPLQRVFGISGLGLAVDPRHLVFDRRAAAHIPFLISEEETRVPLYDHAVRRARTPSWSLKLDATTMPVATYEPTGGTAISRKSYSSGGVAYLAGVDISTLLLDAHNDRAVNTADHYVNRYYPANDLFLRLIMDVYREAASDKAVRLRTAPGGADVPVLLTHDVGESIAFRHAQEFAASERQRGVDATYFIFTKYNVPEFDDDDYLFHSVAARPTASWIRALEEQYGHELANHTVTHAPDFDDPAHWPVGTGAETFQNYYTRFECEGPRPESDCETVPRIRRCRMPDGQCGLKRTIGGSILGELRVAKFLVEEIADDPVVSFRPGYLFWPENLNEALAATDHLYASIGTCNAHLTHLPYQLNHSKGRSELPVYEFCLSSDDQAAPLSDIYEPGTRLYEAVDLIQRVARYGGIFVQLIHPADTWASWDQNLRFQEALIDRIKAVPNLAHFSTFRQFGDFWAARDHVSAEVSETNGQLWLRITSPLPIKGLALDVPKSWRTAEKNNRGLSIRLDQTRGVLLIEDSFSGLLEIQVER